MSEIKYEILNKIGVLSTPALSEIEGLEGEIDHAQRVAPRQLNGLSPEEINIVEGKGWKCVILLLSCPLRMRG